MRRRAAGGGLRRRGRGSRGVGADAVAATELFVTSGPWNSLHTPSRACEDAFWAAQQVPGSLPPQAEACCGVKLGMFATFVRQMHLKLSACVGHVSKLVRHAGIEPCDKHASRPRAPVGLNPPLPLLRSSSGTSSAPSCRACLP